MQATRSGFLIERRFRAPPDMVFRLWTEPAYVTLWWGIEGATIPYCELDVRPGGRWRIDMRAPGGTVYRNEGEYLDVVPCELLVFSDIPDPSIEEYEGDVPQLRRHEVTFTGIGEETQVRMAVTFGNEAERERHFAFGMPRGMEQSLDRLDALIASLRLRPPS